MFLCLLLFERNRMQSDSDKRRTIDTGIHQQGDTAFANYLNSAGVTLSFRENKYNKVKSSYFIGRGFIFYFNLIIKAW